MSEASKPSSVIELSTVYFCDGPIPHVISLRDCGLALRGAAPPALTALYGNQSKQEGFMAARAFAEANRLQFTVIDFLVALDHKSYAGQIKAEEFANHDFLAIQRLARGGADEIAALLRSAGHLGGDNAKPGAILLERPDLVTALLEQPPLRHIKVLAYQARPVMSERVLNVGSVPYGHWSAITEATCRLNPTTRVTLEHPAPDMSPARDPAPRPGKRAPRAK